MNNFYFFVVGLSYIDLDSFFKFDIGISVNNSSLSFIEEFYTINLDLPLTPA